MLCSCLAPIRLKVNIWPQSGSQRNKECPIRAPWHKSNPSQRGAERKSLTTVSRPLDGLMATGYENYTCSGPSCPQADCQVQDSTCNPKHSKRAEQQSSGSSHVPTQPCVSRCTAAATLAHTLWSQHAGMLSDLEAVFTSGAEHICADRNPDPSSAIKLLQDLTFPASLDLLLRMQKGLAVGLLRADSHHHIQCLPACDPWRHCSSSTKDWASLCTNLEPSVPEETVVKTPHPP